MTKIITIDGASSTGKGTLAIDLASELNFSYLLSGNLYRSLANKLIIKQINLADLEEIKNIAQTITIADTYNLFLGNELIAAVASKIATISQVRLTLNKLQLNFAKQTNKGLIVEGRDAGSVVFPKADIKLFLTANLEIRAKRRYNELLNKGIKVIYQQVINDIQLRDQRDVNRSIAPLKKVKDSIVIDTSFLTAKQVLKQALRSVNVDC